MMPQYGLDKIFLPFSWRSKFNRNFLLCDPTFEKKFLSDLLMGKAEVRVKRKKGLRLNFFWVTPKFKDILNNWF